MLGGVVVCGTNVAPAARKVPQYRAGSHRGQGTGSADKLLLVPGPRRVYPARGQVVRAAALAGRVWWGECGAVTPAARLSVGRLRRRAGCETSGMLGGRMRRSAPGAGRAVCGPNVAPAARNVPQYRAGSHRGQGMGAGDRLLLVPGHRRVSPARGRWCGADVLGGRVWWRGMWSGHACGAAVSLAGFARARTVVRCSRGRRRSAVMGKEAAATACSSRSLPNTGPSGSLPRSAFVESPYCAARSAAGACQCGGSPHMRRLRLVSECRAWVDCRCGQKTRFFRSQAADRSCRSDRSGRCSASDRSALRCRSRRWDRLCPPSRPARCSPSVQHSQLGPAGRC